METLNYDLEHVLCNLCGSSDSKLYERVSYNDYLSRRPELPTNNSPILKHKNLANFKFRIVKCKNCGLIYVNPRLHPNSLQRLYQAEHFSYYADTESTAHKMRERTFQIESKELEALVRKIKCGKRILDVGCGGGFFLSCLGNEWEKSGLELNPSAAEFARNKHNLKIYQGDLKEVEFPDNSFDVVKIRGTIEHLPDPMSELKEIFRILKKGGIVAVNTPNIDSLCGKLYREKFRLVCPTHHIYYFSTGTLSKMLREVGFKIEKVSYHYFKTPYASWKDPAKILWDLVSLNILRRANIVSPSFYGNIVDMYASK